MQIGMLWLVTDKKRPLIESVHEAMDYYTTKYGECPDVAYVNPKDLDGTEKSAVIRVATQTVIIRNHIWLGVEEGTEMVAHGQV